MTSTRAPGGGTDHPPIAREEEALPPAGGLPVVLALPAIAGLAFLIVPLLGLVLAAPWGTVRAQLTGPVVFQALRLSVYTASAATGGVHRTRGADGLADGPQ
ncbi:MAG TPA: hypothetical protein VIY28_14980 [Pseudonocardiaceae bacterium]